MQRAAVTGLAVRTPFGDDPDAFWEGLCRGRVPTRRWCSEPGWPGLSCPAATLPPSPSPVEGDPATALAIDLARRALLDAGFDSAPAGCGMALGSQWSNLDTLSRPPRAWPTPLLSACCRALGIDGPAAMTPVGCAAGNMAIAWALDRLESGDAPAMIAGGFDLIGPCAVGGFRLFDNISDTGARPFSADRDGFLMSEGGALLVLESEAAARARGARILAFVSSVGTAHDAAHPTRPSGRGVASALRTALREAGLEPKDLGYVNAHSPGTLANDPAEAAALNDVFGARGVPVGSTKAAGHAQGGASALEAVACIWALRRQLIPPTLGTVEADASLGLDVVIGKPRPAALRHVASVAIAIGGAASALILGWEGA
jgi:3-oxoacyl-(acyl-carrier-protein) synthase